MCCGRRHGEATSRLVAALTALGDGNADQVTEQRLGQETDLRVAGKRRREGTTGAACAAATR